MHKYLHFTLAFGFVFLALDLSSTANAAVASKDCSYARQLVQEDGQTYYVVEDRAPSLYMISRDLYGSEKNWSDIAHWNQLKAPYKLEKGQHLLIKTPPSLNDEEGTKVLISAWTRFKDTDHVEHLKTYQQSAQACLEPKTEPKVAITAPVMLPPPPPIEVEKAAEAAKVEAPESPWKFSTNLNFSSLQIDSTEKATGDKNTLYSKLNYGLELGVERELSEKWALGLAAGLTHVEFKQPSDAEIENPVQNLPSFKLDLDHRFCKFFGMSLGSVYSQHIFSEPTVTGTTLEPVYITEFNLGAKFRLVESFSSKLWFLAEGIYALSTKQKGYDIKNGTGYSAALRYEYMMKKTALSITPKYEFLHQDTEASKDQEQTVLVSLGLSW